MFHYKRLEQARDDNNVIVSVNNTSSSFKYQSNLIKNQVTSNVAANMNPDVPNANRLWKNDKIAVYISNFFSSLELPLIDTKLYIGLD